jgi:hypothetical protein
MKHFSQLSKIQIFPLALSVAFPLAGVVSFVTSRYSTEPAAPPSQSSLPSVLHLVRNHTTSLQVISADLVNDEQGYTLHLKFRNASPDKALTAYAISADDPQAWMTREFLYSEIPAHVIKPGATFTDVIRGVKPDRPVVILCAIFGVNEFEGQRNQAANIINYRFGRKLFLSQALPELQALKRVGQGADRSLKAQAVSNKLVSLIKPDKAELASHLDDLITLEDNSDTVERQVGSGFEFGKQYIRQKLDLVIAKRQQAINTIQPKSANSDQQAEQLFEQMLTRLIDRVEAMKNAH